MTDTTTSARRTRDLFRRAMRDNDRYVVHLRYQDSKGTTTSRCVSPIRFVGSKLVLALCLSRQEPRQLNLERCSNVRLGHADDVMMPYLPGESDKDDTPNSIALGQPENNPVGPQQGLT